MRGVFVSAFTHVGDEPGAFLPVVHWFKIDGDCARRAGFFAEQTGFALEIVIGFESFFGDQLYQAATTRREFWFFIGI